MDNTYSKKFKKIFIYSILSVFFIFLMVFSLFYFGLLTSFSSVKFDRNRLGLTNTFARVFDSENKPIVQSLSQNKNIKINEVPKNVIDAFISIEDKQFFKHKGINYKRIAKAFLKNLMSFKLKEGASTISQQLVKNTHLTNEKTFRRKFDELLLAQKLEKTMNKNEILEAYLNAIYFGNGAFGINQAAQRYFSKNASELNLAEGATLAAIIRSPGHFSPTNSPIVCIKRRNLVLKEMKKDKKITQNEYDAVINSSLNLNLNKNFLGNNDYYFAVINEACDILKISEKDLMIKNFKIYTYKDCFLQENVENEISKLNEYTQQNDNIDGLALILDNKTGGIKAFYGKSDYNLLNLYRQPGSVFKPLISYAPALEYNIISPSSLILDEKLKINDYSPSNFKDKYNGWISSKESLARSLNIPSIKILEYVGIDKAKSFVTNFGIGFEKNDVGYSLALGGMTKGVKIKDLTNCYQAIANNGRLVKCSFIKEIKSENEKTVYKHSTFEKQVMRDDTAFLLTDMLKESVKNGTCRKLGKNDFEIAGKTGTVDAGDKNRENSDVWNLSYTTENTMCVWFGSTNKNLISKSITGANGPTALASNIYSKIKKFPQKFEKPNSVEEVEVNDLEYRENNKILLANETTPGRYKRKAFFSKYNLPKEQSNMFDEINDFEIFVNVCEDEVVLSLNANRYLWYEIIKQNEDSKKILAVLKNKDGKIEVKDNEIKNDNFYTYYAIAHYLCDNDLKLLTTKKSNEVKVFLAQKSPAMIIKKAA